MASTAQADAASAPASPQPVLFLSHAGSDTEAARRLREALLRTKAARAAGLKVWFDKDDLLPGEPWACQLERAIAQATAFAVYVGAAGVINWVEAEVRLAHARAIGARPSLPFIPILSRESQGVEALPGFARQFQGVEDVEANGFDNDAFRKLLAVAVGAGGDPGRLVLETDPFFGLEPIREERSHLFFGREAEVAELADRLVSERLLLIVGDSGSGKSSLVHAGLIPAWRGGVIAERAEQRPNAHIWHTIDFRPRNNPRRGLHQAVEHAARALGRSVADAAEYARLAKDPDPDTVRMALRCGLDPDTTRTLLFIDQFEELVIQTPERERRDLVELLLNLADPEDPAVTVVMTMRSDYANLLYGTPTRALHEALVARADARYTLRGVSKEGLEQIVRRPLLLAGREDPEIDAVVAQVTQDVGERPGDLALVQFALTRMWESRPRFGDDLVSAYVGVGGVRGALAREAERVYREELGGDANEGAIAAAMIRLGQLGGVGGLTRRVAAKEEFSKAGWAVMQRLASPEGNRLVLLGEDEDGKARAEIAHEALLTQWERLHSWLNGDPERLRQLYRLAERVSAWHARQAAGEASEEDLAAGSYLAAFSELRREHPGWLSSIESEYVEDSEARHERVQREREARIERERALREEAESSRRATEGTSRLFKRVAVVAAALAVVAVALAVFGGLQTMKANEQALQAIRNESSALTALANANLERGLYHEAKVLALSAWPRRPDDRRAGDSEMAWPTLARAAVATRQLVPSMRHEVRVRGAQFNAEETAILSWSVDGAVQLWDVRRGEALLAAPIQHEGGIAGARFNAEETAILSWSVDGTVRLWDAHTGEALHAAPIQHEGSIAGAQLNAEGTVFLSWSRDGTVRLWDARTGEALHAAPIQHQGMVLGAQLNAEGTAILSWSTDGTVQLWDARTGEALLAVRHVGGVGILGAQFNAEETAILSWSMDGTVRLWDVPSGEALLATPIQHEGGVLGVQLNAEGTAILSWAIDGTVRLWDARTGEALHAAPIQHEGMVLGAQLNAEGTAILSWSRDGTVQLWDVASGEALLAAPLRHEDSVYGAQFNAEETAILSWSGDGTVRLWDANIGEALHAAPIQHEGSIAGAQLNAERTAILSWARDGTVRLWDVHTGEALLAAPIQHEGGIAGAQLNAAGTAILSWARDGTVRLWDVHTGEALLAAQVPLPEPGLWVDGGVEGAQFDAEETAIVSWARDGTVRVWDAASGEALLAGPLQHEEAVLGAQFNAEGRAILSWSIDGTVRLWDARSGKALRTASMQHGGAVAGAQLNAAGTAILAWSLDGMVGLWDAASGEALHAARMWHEGGVLGAQFNAAETAILSWSEDHTVRLWDARTGEALLAMRHEGTVWGAQFNAKETAILSWARDGTVWLWDARTGEALLAAPLQHEGGVLGAQFNAAETAILSWSGDGTMRLWDAPSGDELDLRKVACAGFDLDKGFRPTVADYGQSISAYGVATTDPICKGLPPWPDSIRIEVPSRRNLTFNPFSNVRLETRGDFP